LGEGLGFRSQCARRGGGEAIRCQLLGKKTKGDASSDREKRKLLALRKKKPKGEFSAGLDQRKEEERQPGGGANEKRKVKKSLLSGNSLPGKKRRCTFERGVENGEGGQRKDIKWG